MFTVVLTAALLSSARVEGVGDETGRCVAAYEQGQQRRKAGRLLEARTEFAACSRDACPDLARRDCVAWLRELEADVPSVVVGAHSTSGEDVVDAELALDDQQVQSRLTGSPIEMNPGEHRLRVRASDGRGAEQTILVKLGEKNRLVVLTFDDVPSRAPPLAAASTDEASEGRGTSSLPWLLGGIGAVMAVAGGTLDILGSADLRQLRSDCAPDCSSSDVDGARAKIIAGDALLVVGGATLLTAIYFALKRPTSAVTFTGKVVW